MNSINLATLMLTLLRNQGGGVANYADKVLGYAPTAYNPMADASGESFPDLSGNNYRMDYYFGGLGAVGGDTFVDNAPAVSFANGDYAWFEGLVQAGQLGWSGTYLYWFKISTAVANDGTIDNWLWIQGSGSIFKITKTTSTQMQLRIHRGTQVDTNFNYTPDAWTCVAVTMNTSEARLYVNGALEATITGYGTNAPALIYASDFFNIAQESTWGAAAHWAYWANTILTAEQIANLAIV